MRFSILISVFCLAFVLMASVLSADIPGKISYQGYLTDSGGDPLDTGVLMIFTIYDSTGVSKWFEEHFVNVSGGVFSVALGSINSIPDTVFSGEERYLGIKVGNDPEISPRTLLTSSPQTFISQRVDGDIKTGEGSMIINDNMGDSAIVFDADAGRGSAQIYMIEPGDDNVVKLNLGTNSDGSFFSMFGTNPDGGKELLGFGGNHNSNSARFSMYHVQPPDAKEILTMSTSPTTGASIKMATPVPEPPHTLLAMDVKETDNPGEWGSFFSMYLMEPVDKEILEISGTPSTGASIKMFNPQPEPPRVYLEMLTNSTEGASMAFFDDAGKVMGVEPVPFNEGFGMYFMDPGDDGKLLELLSNHSMNEVNINFMDPDDDSRYLSISGTASTGASIKMFNPQPEPPHALVNISGNYDIKSGYAQIELYDPDQTLTNEPQISLTSGSSDAAKISLFNTQLGMQSTTVIEMDYDSLNGGGTVKCVSDADSSLSYLTGRELYIGTDMGPSIYFHYAGSAYLAGYVGIGAVATTNILQIQQSSVTDPIADAWTVYGSKRLKTNIRPLEDALDKVSRLQGVSFKWKSDDKSGIGLIAEDVGEILPEVVTYEKNGVDAQSIDYDHLTAVLVEAIKELKAENEELRNRIEQLENGR